MKLLEIIDEMKYEMLSMDDIRRPNGSVGTQGYTPDGILGLVKHISNIYGLNLPEYSTLKELILNYQKYEKSYPQV